jgi:hypothetical protein
LDGALVGPVVVGEEEMEFVWGHFVPRYEICA